MRHIATVAIAMTLTLALSTPVSAKTKAPDHIVYSGQLLGEDGAPIAGVFPLTFALHKSERSKKKMWFEQHWVAVEEGIYTVELGRDRKLPRGLDVSDSYLSVSLTGGGELVRERLSERNIPGAHKVADASAPPVVAPSVVTPPRPAGGVVAYAEKAGVAYEAETARTADRVGNLTLEDLDKRYRQKSGAHLGTARRYSGSVGGDGGHAYRLVCPKGYVAVGVRGGSGIYLDSIEVICAPLE